VKDWSRLFLSPGMGHCSGGSGALDTFDMLSAAVNWVEKSTPPDSITATGPRISRTQQTAVPVSHARAIQRQRDPENAANYSCRQ
jgi:feruloyl esterase